LLWLLCQHGWWSSYLWFPYSWCVRSLPPCPAFYLLRWIVLNIFLCWFSWFPLPK
jgi:hypothetical protein